MYHYFSAEGDLTAATWGSVHLHGSESVGVLVDLSVGVSAIVNLTSSWLYLRVLLLGILLLLLFLLLFLLLGNWLLHGGLSLLLVVIGVAVATTEGDARVTARHVVNLDRGDTLVVLRKLHFLCAIYVYNLSDTAALNK